MASSFSQPWVRLFVVATLLLAFMVDECFTWKELAVGSKYPRQADLDALVPPYVDCYGAPTTTMHVSFPDIGMVKLGMVYEKNSTQVAPTVLVRGTALKSSNFYSLVTVDPDAPSADESNVSNILHYMVINIPGSIKPTQDVATVGQVAAPWLGPDPPIGTHRYMFLVFDQGYTGIEVSQDDRALFSVRNFTSTYNMGFPLGGTLFRVSAPNSE